MITYLKFVNSNPGTFCVLRESVRLVLAYIFACLGTTDRRLALHLVVGVALGEAANASAHFGIYCDEGPTNAARASILAKILTPCSKCCKSIVQNRLKKYSSGNAKHETS